jgi:hypothetical protein
MSHQWNFINEISINTKGEQIVGVCDLNVIIFVQDRKKNIIGERKYINMFFFQIVLFA